MSNTEPYYFMVVKDEPYRIWTAGPDREKVESSLLVAEAYYGKRCYVISEADMLEAQRKHWLDQECKEVTEQEFNDSLGILPPLKHHTRDGLERFMFSEFTCYTYTRQYASYQGRYLTKTVDAYDETTWININDFNKEQVDEAIHPASEGDRERAHH